MAKQAKAEKKVTKLAGCMLPNTSVGNIYNVLKDGKTHKIASLKSCLTRKSVNVRDRLRRLHQKGLRTKQWHLVVSGGFDDGTVRMHVGKPPAGVSLREKSEKEAPSRKSVATKSKPASASKPPARAKVQDVPVSED